MLGNYIDLFFSFLPFYLINHVLKGVQMYTPKLQLNVLFIHKIKNLVNLGPVVQNVASLTDPLVVKG